MRFLVDSHYVSGYLPQLTFKERELAYTVCRRTNAFVTCCQITNELGVLGHGEVSQQNASRAAGLDIDICRSCERNWLVNACTV